MQEFDLFNHKLVPETLFITANAGSGKTFNIMWTTLRLIIEEKISAEKIVIITFTEKAATQIFQKIQLTAFKLSACLHGELNKKNISETETDYLKKISIRDIPKLKSVNKIFIGTIHSFVKNCLSKDLLTSQLFSNTSLSGLSRKLLTKASRHIWRKYNKQPYVSILPNPDELKNLFLNIYNYQNINISTLAGAEKVTFDTNNSQPPDLKLFKYTLLAELSDIYQALKKQHHHFDFNDLISELILMLDNPNSKILSILQASYQAVIVDEFQDTDTGQLYIIQKIFNQVGRYIMLVGDPKQSIYTFRGADLDVFLSLQTKIPAEKKFKLSSNYRSSDGINQAINEIFTNHQNPFLDSRIKYFPSHIPQIRRDQISHPIKKTDVPVRFIQISPNQQLNKKEAQKNILTALVDQVLTIQQQHRQKDGTELEIAVLVATNKQVADVQKALENANIKCAAEENLSYQSLVNSEAYYDINCLLKIFQNGVDNEEKLLNNILASQLIGLDINTLQQLRQDKAAYTAIKLFFNSLANVYQSRGIVAALWLINQNQTLTSLQSQCNSAYHYSANSEYEKKLYHILDGIEHYEIKYTNKSTANALSNMDDEIIDLINQPENQQRPGVKVMTYYKAKGLEFSVVILPFLWSQSITPDKKNGLILKKHQNWAYNLNPNADDLVIKSNMDKAEQRRIIYTSLTRAIDKIILLQPYYANRSKIQKVSDLELLLSNEQSQKPGDIFKYIEHLCQRKPDLFESKIFDKTNINKHQNMQFKTELPATLVKRFSYAEKFLSLNINKTLNINFFWQPSTIQSFTSLKSSIEPFDIIPVAESLLNHPVENATLDNSQIVDFPANQLTGIFFHDLLDKWDFKQLLAINFLDNISLQNRIDIYFAFLDKQQRETLGKIAQATLENLMAIEFNDPSQKNFCLKDVKKNNVLKEWNFFVSSNDKINIKSQANNQYLQGVVDMVFNYNGYYYIIDWKTAKLPDYDQHTLKADIIKNHYKKQAEIYVLATEKYLQNIKNSHAKKQKISRYFIVYLRGVVQKKGIYAIDF